MWGDQSEAFYNLLVTITSFLKVKTKIYANPNDDWWKRAASQGETASVRNCSFLCIGIGSIDTSVQSPATIRGCQSCRPSIVYTGAYGKVISSNHLPKLVDRVRTVAYVYVQIQQITISCTGERIWSRSLLHADGDTSLISRYRLRPILNRDGYIDISEGIRAEPNSSP